MWKQREKFEQIGRICAVNPSEGERYYLRMLLNHKYGATSFEDLLKVDGIQYATFKESAEKHGLLESNNYISECLNDASNFQMPYELRHLFATILIYCEPTNIYQLWIQYYNNLSEDFRNSRVLSDELCQEKTLSSIKLFIERMGKCINDFDLPNFTHDIIDQLEVDDHNLSKEIVEEFNVITPAEDFNIIHKLNIDQKKVFEEIMECVLHQKNKMFFIDGPGGTGKTYLYRALLATLKHNGHIALATATSGVAASILPGGRTAHSRFKIPINTTETSTCTISKQSGLARLLRKASIIIWDEAPMVKRTAIESFDRTLRDIMNNSNFFGGKVIVFGGDFRQVVPVIRRASKIENIKYSLVNSYLWSSMEIYRLTKNMRAQNDSLFCEFLLRIGNGDEPETDNGLVKIPHEMTIPYVNDEESENSLMHHIFCNLDQNYTSSDYLMDRAILATRNVYVDKLNNKLIKCFPGNEFIYYSYDNVVDDKSNIYQVEFLNSLTPNGLPPHQLILKKNCPIMLLRNLDPTNGLCNGTRLICREFKKNIILAEISTGQFSGRLIMIPKIPLRPSDDESLPFKFMRKQFSVRVCFAMTINKSQGQTIPNVGIYLPHHVFSHGQLYVALSRGISMNTTKVLIVPDEHCFNQGSYTKNIVYKEILISAP